MIPQLSLLEGGPSPAIWRNFLDYLSLSCLLLRFYFDNLVLTNSLSLIAFPLLQDQVTRYRSLTATKQINEPYAPVLAEKQIPVFYIAIAIAAAILGLLLGKFLLWMP